ENEDELVLPAVPVQQRRLAARLQAREVDAEIAQAKEVAEGTLLPPAHAAEKGLRIVRGFGARGNLQGLDCRRARCRAVDHRFSLSRRRAESAVTAANCLPPPLQASHEGINRSSAARVSGARGSPPATLRRIPCPSTEWLASDCRRSGRHRSASS